MFGVQWLSAAARDCPSWATSIRYAATRPDGNTSVSAESLPNGPSCERAAKITPGASRQTVAYGPLWADDPADLPAHFRGRLPRHLGAHPLRGPVPLRPRGRRQGAGLPCRPGRTAGHLRVHECVCRWRPAPRRSRGVPQGDRTRVPLSRPVPAQGGASARGVGRPDPRGGHDRDRRVQRRRSGAGAGLGRRTPSRVAVDRGRDRTGPFCVRKGRGSARRRAGELVTWAGG